MEVEFPLRMEVWEVEERIARGLPAFTKEEAQELRQHYLERIPSKLTRMRYHSFLVYLECSRSWGGWSRPGRRRSPSVADSPVTMETALESPSLVSPS